MKHKEDCFLRKNDIIKKMKYLLEDIKYYGLFKTIKYAYQRVVRGYDERIYWSFGDYLFQFLDPLEEFCQKELKNESIGFNSKRKLIYKTTLEKIMLFKKADYKVENIKAQEMWKYIGENMMWYWN